MSKQRNPRGLTFLLFGGSCFQYRAGWSHGGKSSKRNVLGGKLSTCASGPVVVHADTTG